MQHSRVAQLLLIAAVGLAAAACDQPSAGTNKAQSGGQNASGKLPLTADDLYSTGTLSQSERELWSRRCAADYRKFEANTQFKPRTTSADARLSLEFLERVFPRFCECFVDQLADRSSKLQFLMALQTLAQADLRRREVNIPAFPDYERIAVSLGMARTDFEVARREVTTLLGKSMAPCRRILEMR